jgi:carbohydrate-selective porin OprB
MRARGAAIGPGRGTAARFFVLVLTALCVFGGSALAQAGLDRPNLLGDWGGTRTWLQERGVRFDFGYVSDTLWGLESQRNSFASWNRFRATVDINLGALTGLNGWYFHATGLAQGTANLGQALGLLTGPSGSVSFSTIRSIRGGSRKDGWTIVSPYAWDSLPARTSMETRSMGRRSS